ncbi:MAG: hypothetical protein LBB57_06650, partial [Clostridiales Family XIII bacterium]|nr:hypothetical protein [Clostridiales Family XIII bacterium]
EAFFQNHANPREIKYILVVNRAKRAWLGPFADALRSVMKRQLKIWNASLVAITEKQALHSGLISRAE